MCTVYCLFEGSDEAEDETGTQIKEFPPLHALLFCLLLVQQRSPLFLGVLARF